MFEKTISNRVESGKMGLSVLWKSLVFKVFYEEKWHGKFLNCLLTPCHSRLADPMDCNICRYGGNPDCYFERIETVTSKK
ncbi:hypothetical protein EV146_11452 [Mesobacillus foraminis]|uniref:Uncharacterized protein n=1 Tax=Mesobacillus foraminis TaxID=279826 RepID=A0A4R2B2I5_9BACI|nr:hypothetical protein EV146_11452 [Mesobacillus foraminis]